MGGLQQIEQMMPLLKKHGLEMRSLYVNSTLHEAGQADKSIEEVLAAAAKAKAFGTQIIVTNPSPIRWGGPENKTDEQLKVQAAALDKLGAKLRQMGLTLAYHNHDIELRNAAREFHHMMVGTDPARRHSVSRRPLGLSRLGQLAGGPVRRAQALRPASHRAAPSPVAKRRLDRGLRRRATSTTRVWQSHLLKIGVKPLLVLEQAIETGSPNTMNAGRGLHEEHRNTPGRSSPPSHSGRRVFIEIRGTPVSSRCQA